MRMVRPLVLRNPLGVIRSVLLIVLALSIFSTHPIITLHLLAMLRVIAFVLLDVVGVILSPFLTGFPSSLLLLFR